MKNLFSFIFVLIVAIALIGCAQPKTSVNNTSYQRNGEPNLVQVSHVIVSELENNLKAPISSDDTIIVASFVDVNNLNESSTFGRIMAEQVGSRLAQKGYKVIEMKLRQNSVFVQQEMGEFLLSRDLKDISRNHNASAVVVGTYGNSKNKVYVSVRIVDPKNSVILASSNCRIPAPHRFQKSMGLIKKN